VVCKWNACKWKSVENSVCSLDDPTTTTIQTTIEAAAAEQRSVPLSGSSATTSTTTSTSTSTTTWTTTSTSTTTSTASKTTSTTTSTPKMSTTSMTKGKPVLTPTDSRLLFVEPEIYQSDPVRNDLNLKKKYFQDKKNLKIIQIIERCEIIPADWNCSSGSKHHSVCIRQCQADVQAEAIKCKCKNNQCHWERRGKPCENIDIGTGSETGNESEQYFIRRENGNLLSGQGISELTDDSAFSQLFRDIQLSNSGQMVFNINYYKNYYKDPTI